MGLGNLQIDQQGGERLGAHAGAAIGVHDELAGRDVLLGNGLVDQLHGQLGGFAMGDHPADHVPAEDVEDHVIWKYDHFSGPRNFVISHDHTWLGWVASNSGLA